MQASQKVTPFLWFEKDAGKAAKFYVSIFKSAKIMSESPQSVTLDFQGQTLILFNGGPMYQLSPAVSLLVSCKTQEEIDSYWGPLLKGGKPSRCGWLTDKFGLSWQIIPEELPSLLGNPDRDKAQRAMKAMMSMVKLDIQHLRDAAAAT